MGKITRNEKTGTYSVRVSLTDSLTGRRVQRRISARTRRLLDAEVARIRAEWNSGSWIEPDKTTLGEWLETWHKTYRASSSSRYTRGRHIRHHIGKDTLRSVPLTRLRYSHIQDYVDRMVLDGFAPNTIRGVMTTLSMALTQAVRRQIIPSNPCTGLQLPATGPKRWCVLDEDQARRLVTDTQGDALHAFWVLSITLGIRRGELLALNWKDVDLAAGTLRVERTMTLDEQGRRYVGDRPKRESSRRVLRLPTVCLDALRRHRARQNERRLAAGDTWTDEDAVFDSGLGERLTSGALYREFRDVKAAVNLPADFKMHDTRHTAATLMIHAGVPIPVIASILGHANPAVTLNTYSHIFKAMEEQATDRIDGLFGERRAGEG